MNDSHAMGWELTEDAKRDLDPCTQRVLEAVNVQRGQLIGEIGAGAGYLAFKLAALVGPEGRVWATDLNRHWVDHLRAHARQTGVHNVAAHRVWHSRFLGLPRDGSLHAVVMIDSVCFRRPRTPVGAWLNLDLRYLRALLRRLRPGGRVVYKHWRHEGDVSTHAVIALFSAAGFGTPLEHVELPGPGQFLLAFER